MKEGVIVEIPEKLAERVAQIAAQLNVSIDVLLAAAIERQLERLKGEEWNRFFFTKVNHEGIMFRN